MWFDLMIMWIAMGTSMLALFGLYGAFCAKSLGEFAAPMLGTTMMSGFSYLMWTA